LCMILSLLGLPSVNYIENASRRSGNDEKLSN
jgi:hypothetical protein